jgi:hypothetical protein
LTQHVPLKGWYQYIKLHDIQSYNTAIFSVNPTLPFEGVTEVNYENQEEVVAFTDFADWRGYF